MAVVVKDLELHINMEEEEEEEELFEINLEVVNSIPPPHYFENYFTATGNTLFANCLLPIADVSSAIPIVSKLDSKGLNSSFLQMKA